MNKRVLIWAVTVGLMGSILTSGVVSAESVLSDEQLQTHAMNDAMFMMPCEAVSGSGICGSNQNYAGDQVLTDAQLKAVKANQPFYEKAASKYGFPWGLLAAIHYREHGLLRDNPANGEGAYQLHSYVGSHGKFIPMGPLSDEEFQRQTDIAAKLIKENYGSGLDLNTDNGAKAMFYHYNGVSSKYEERAIRMGFSKEEAKRGEGSPYVMNRYDAKRDPNSSEVDSNWIGKYTSDGVYSAGAKDMQWGAFTVYKALTCEGSGTGSASDPSCTGDVEGSKNINATAVALAWPEGTKEEEYRWHGGSATDAFKDAFDTVFPKRDSWKHAASRDGASCDVFVGTVVQYSGYDKEFPHGLANVMDHINDHKDLWEKIEFSGNESDVKGGDILYRSSHIAIAVRDSDNKLWIAEANYPRLYGHIRSFKKDYQYIFRAKSANNSTNGVSVKDGVRNATITGKTTTSGQGNGDIGASALELAWSLGKSSEAANKPTKKFQEYFSTLNHNIGGCAGGGKSCDQFVTATVRYSGVDKDFPFGSVPTLLTYVEGNDDWEKVEVDDVKKLDKYQSGDLVFYYKSGSNSPGHVGIYAEDGGKGYDVSASECERFGLVRDSSFITNTSYHTGKRVIYRNKNNKNGTSSCNVCAGVGTSEGGEGLMEGGYTSKDAAEKAVMDVYRKYDGKWNLGTSKCHTATDNCSTFSAWFIKKYVGWDPSVGVRYPGGMMGRSIANNMYLAYHSKYPNITLSKTPSVYSVVSWNSAMPYPGGSTNHTGVILGINKEAGVAFVGEAAWCKPSYTGVKVWKLSQLNGRAMYLDVSAYVKGLTK